jgi:HD-like signal output (HDOD) protein
VRTLVISSGLVSGFKTVPGLDLKQFWKYSLHTAVSAKWIAKKTKENTDLAFTIGMMHAIGQLVIHSAAPEQAMALDKVAGPLDSRRLDAEQASLGYTFADVGAELAKRWKFPHTFSETISAFPEPHHNGELNRLAAVVALAAWRARVASAGLNDDEIAACYPVDLAEELGLEDNALIDEMPSPDELSAGLEELIK